MGSMLGDVFLHLLPEAWATVGSGELEPEFRSVSSVAAAIYCSNHVTLVFLINHHYLT